jgi:DNA polymerase III delta subunit
LANPSLGVLEFLKVADRQAFEPAIFVLNGEDEYLHELVIKKLERRYVDADFRDFNQRRLDCGRSTTAGEVSGLLAELPTLVEHRLVFLHNLNALPKEQSARLLETWRRDISPGTVLAVSAWGSAKENPWLGALGKLAANVDCSLQGADIDALLAAFARKKGARVDAAVLRCLRERVGESLRGLISHLERCLLSLRPGESLDAHRIEELVPFSAEVAMWKMTAAIGQRNHREALAILDRQLDRGEAPGAILGYLQSYLTSLIQTAGLMKQLGNAAAVAQAIPRKKEFQVKKTLEELRTWSSDDLEAGLEGMLRADFKAKGGAGGADPRLMLQMLILKLCSRARGQQRARA